MNFILCLQGKHKAKVFSKGDSMESLLIEMQRAIRIQRRPEQSRQQIGRRKRLLCSGR